MKFILSKFNKTSFEGKFNYRLLISHATVFRTFSEYFSFVIHLITNYSMLDINRSERRVNCTITCRMLEYIDQIQHQRFDLKSLLDFLVLLSFKPRTGCELLLFYFFLIN